MKQATTAAAALSYLPRQAFKCPGRRALQTRWATLAKQAPATARRARAAARILPRARTCRGLALLYSHGDLFQRILPRLPVDGTARTIATAVAVQQCRDDGERQTFADYVTMVCERRAPFALKRNVRASRRTIFQHEPLARDIQDPRAGRPIRTVVQYCSLPK